MTLEQMDSHRINGARPVVPELLDVIGFTNHALERFASRAGLCVTSRRIVEPIVRDLLLQEGLVVGERPHWARSRNTADLYLQLGEWMLFIGTRDEHPSPRFAIVTVVNGPTQNTWRGARRRGYIFTPPPPMVTGRGWRAPNPLVSVAVTVRARRSGPALDEGLIAAVRRTHAERRAQAQDDFERVALQRWRRPDRRYARARMRARKRHLKRYRLS